MWYLVVPPIVVILSISFLLWYLSRKGDDPVIAQKVLESENGKPTISFPRTREFFLRILEKSGQHSKVVSLRMHNTLHDFTQSVKASRIKVRTALPPAGKGQKVVSEEVPVIVASYVAPQEKNEEVPRPMVSELATHPEKKKRVHPNVVREESLITRIARDPKDFTAYEELGDYYLEMENIKDAKECYRQVLKLSPVHRMVKIKIRRLEKLLTRAGE